MKRVDSSALYSLVASVSVRANELPRQKLVLVPGHVGAAYKGELMFVGRAPNGWTDAWDPRTTGSRSAILDLVNGEVEAASPGRVCPLSWVSERWGINSAGYNTKRSAFWRLARDLIIRLGGVPEDKCEEAWSSHLVWSNLYKIGPSARRKPSERLCGIQHDAAVDVLRAELRGWRPKRVVFATGLDWAEEFLNELASSVNFRRPKQTLASCGSLVGGARFVVVPHPQGKKLSIVAVAAMKGLSQ